MRLLQITYYYPPMGGAGVQRALKFSKYLPEFGIQPVVLAAHEPGYVVDPSLESDMPASLRVERIEYVPLLSRLRRILTSFRSMSRPALKKSTEISAVPLKRTKLRDIALKIYACSQFPDDKARWAQLAFERACRLVQEEGIELILSSAPPYSAHALAARVSKATGCPWVADYRDLWIENPGYAAPGWRKFIDQKLENRWLATAAGLITVTPSLASMLADRAPRGTAVKLIENGYDESDFSGLSRAQRDDNRFVITHVGTFYGHRSPISFLIALEQLLLRDRSLSGRVEVRFVGSIGERFLVQINAFSARFPGVIQHIDYVPHNMAIQEMLDADLLLLVVGGGEASRSILTGKLFEYMRARRPVLLLGPEDGDAAALLRQHTSCVIAPADKPQVISVALENIMHDDSIFQSQEHDGIESFERKSLTGNLAKFLSYCLETSRG